MKEQLIDENGMINITQYLKSYKYCKCCEQYIGKIKFGKDDKVNDIINHKKYLGSMDIYCYIGNYKFFIEVVKYIKSPNSDRMYKIKVRLIPEECYTYNDKKHYVNK